MVERAYAADNIEPIEEPVVPTGENQFSTNVTVIYQIQ
jgi:hypothetical protein